MLWVEFYVLWYLSKIRSSNETCLIYIKQKWFHGYIITIDQWYMAIVSILMKYRTEAVFVIRFQRYQISFVEQYFNFCSRHHVNQYALLISLLRHKYLSSLDSSRLIDSYHRSVYSRCEYFRKKYQLIGGCLNTNSIIKLVRAK